MCAEIEHRGPDDQGYYLDGPLGLGMRRLSIIDLAGGHQPIASESETRRIVFNGEIYNYRSLRDELQRSGHRFRTKSDTETILHQYEQTGANCVHRLNGMFAFAIWDAPDRLLFLARDRLGIKPLYYYWDGETFLFASEIKAILASGLVERRLNPQGLWHYLSYRYVPAPLTIWQNICKVPPGHTVTLAAGNGEPKLERYWDIVYSREPAPDDPEGDREIFTELFLDSVRNRLIADVPVGMFLSGGLDSSSVAAAVKEVHNSSLSTFSVGYRSGEECNELGYARQVAEHLGCEHHEILIDEGDVLDFLPRLVWHTDEPMADPSAIPLYYVAGLAVQDVKVVLSGEGSDEVLAGYDFDSQVRGWERVARFQQLPRWLRDTAPTAVFRALGMQGRVEWLERANIPLAERNRRLLPMMTSYFSSAEKQALWTSAPPLEGSERLYEQYYERSGTHEPLHQLLYAACQDWLVEDLLMKADRMSMANSLELRVPFLDHRLVEFLATRSPATKIRRDGNGRHHTKYLLRRFAEPRLPRTILHRAKRGFPVPILPWFGNILGAFSREALLGQESYSSCWFDKEAVAGLLDRAQAGNEVAAERAWLLLVLEFWARRWL
jgi:asparagine synthase (glutamine-hydrolysing)